MHIWKYSAIFSLKMYFNDLGIQIFSGFYIKVFNLIFYLVASVNEILNDLGISYFWLSVSGLYIKPTPITLIQLTELTE